MNYWKEKVADKLSRLLADSPASSPHFGRESPTLRPDTQAIPFPTTSYSDPCTPTVSSVFLSFFPNGSARSNGQKGSNSTEQCKDSSSWFQSASSKSWRFEQLPAEENSVDNSPTSAREYVLNGMLGACERVDNDLQRSTHICEDIDTNEISTSENISRNLLNLMDQSSFISAELYEFLSSSIPNIVRGCQWVLLYSTSKHGISLRTLLRNSDDLPGPCLLDVKPAAKVPLAKKPMFPTKKGSSSGSESDSDSDSDGDIKPAAKTPPVKKPMVLTKTESSSSSESDSDSDSDEDVKPAAKVPPTKKTVVPTKKELISSSESGSDSDSDEGESSESEDEPQTKKLKTLSQTTPVGAQVDDSSDEDDRCDESEEVDEKSLKNRSRVEANVSAPTSSGKPEKDSAKTAIAAKTLPSGSTTLFVGNLSFPIEREHLEQFFKDAGEVVDIRFASNEDGRFRGFGHVQFTSEFATKKAMELNGRELLGRAVRLDIAHERGTPGALRERPFQKPNRATIFVKGFNKCLDEEQVRNNLREHFGEGGEIVRISIPTDHESGAVKGFAYIDFASTDSFSKALELNGSELEGYALTVDEAGPGGGGGRSGGRGCQDRGDRFSGSRGGGRFPDGRGGRFGGRGGGGGGRGEGRGRTNRSNFAGTGKKTTFDED